MTFRDLGLSTPILTALTEQGYQEPSPIQQKAIPPGLEGRDVLGCAQTGTGKTCAFATPILQRLAEKPVAGRPIRALILTPTRELAIQIGESLVSYSAHLSLRSTVIFGGVGQNPQVQAIKKGVDILVATPGRLGDLYQQKLLDLSKIEIFVLDEADRMLDMGFIHDVRKILNWLPQKKQTMLFSATMPGEIQGLVDGLLKNPVRVAVDPVSSPVEAIDQTVYMVDRNNKTKLLAHLVKELGVKNALVFTRTKHGANKVARDLEKKGISAAAIHGNKSQTARQQALSDFKAGHVQCLVATDIAARGLDIEELSHVFNYNLPEVPETYIHRIGRTGRAGREGKAVAFCDFGEKTMLRDIEKLMGISVPVAEGHPWPMEVFEAPKKDQRGRVIDPDDEEARQMARERRQQRTPSQKSVQKPMQRTAQKPAQKQPQKPMKTAQPAAKQQAAPQVQQQKKRQPTQKPAAAQQRKGRGVRSGTVIDTGSAMPQTTFKRRNPLEGDQIMDATARLLAPRKTTPAAKRDAGAQPQRATKKTGNGAANHSNGQAKRRSNSGGRRMPRDNGPVMRPTQTKDSTEQKTLMKPYYLGSD